MEKVILFKLETQDIKISMEIYFNEKGQLIFDGYDIGKTVEECWGDADYEYRYTIDPLNAKKIHAVFGIDDSNPKGLLLEIQKRFSGNDAYSRFGEFMDKNEINYTPFTWT